MPRDKQLDNSTFIEKVRLREHAVDVLESWGVTDPAILETHGGKGELWAKVYSTFQRGTVFETDGHKVRRLALQRPTWAVYQADCLLIGEGDGSHLAYDLVDFDPYGECWPVVDAFFQSERPLKDRMILVVNDGLRQKLAMGGAWDVESMKGMVAKHGNDLHPIYLQVCEDRLGEVVAPVGYHIDAFKGYYCGNKKAMTHFMAVLMRQSID